MRSQRYANSIHLTPNSVRAVMKRRHVVRTRCASRSPVDDSARFFFIVQMTEVTRYLGPCSATVPSKMSPSDRSIHQSGSAQDGGRKTSFWNGGRCARKPNKIMALPTGAYLS